MLALNELQVEKDVVFNLNFRDVNYRQIIRKCLDGCGMSG